MGVVKNEDTCILGAQIVNNHKGAIVEESIKSKKMFRVAQHDRRKTINLFFLKLIPDLMKGRPCDSEINLCRRKHAFTLAEILITVGIIGMLAAITIPTLVSNYQKRQWQVGLQEGYSILNQAIKSMQADGISAYRDFDYNDYNSATSGFYKNV